MALLETIDVILGAKTDKLDAGLASGKGKVNSFVGQLKSAAADTSVGKSIGGIFTQLGALGPAGLAAGGIVAGGMALIAAGGVAAGVAIHGINGQLGEIDSIGDSAKRLGLTFNELVVSRLALGRSSGMDEGTIDASLQKMQLNLREAQSGTGDLAMELQALGLDAGELLRAGPVEAIKQVSGAAQQMKNPVDQTKLAFDLFGKAGAGLVTALRDGPEAIEAMQNRAKALGLELSQAQVEQVGAANDAWEDLQLIATGAFRQIAAEVAPVLTTVFSSVTDIATEFGGWTGYIRPIVDTTVLFTGNLYDAYEIATLTHKTLYNIATLNFSQVGEDIKAAASFDTGDKLLAKVNEARRAAEESARKPAGGDVDLSAFEAAEAARKKRESDEEKAKQQVVDRLQAMRDEVSLLGQTKEAVELIKFARSGANEQQMAEFEVLQKLKKEQEEIDDLKKRGEAMTDRLKSPAEQFKTDMDELKKLRESGSINETTFLRGQREAILKRDKAMERPEAPKIGFLEQGSVAAYSQGLSNQRADKQERGNKLLEEIDATLKRLENKPEKSGLKQI